MNPVDLVLAGLLIPFALRGFFRGFLREAASLAGMLAGAVLAVAAAGPLGLRVEAELGVQPEVALGIAAGGTFLVVYIAALLIGALLDRVARAIFLGPLNRTAGVAFGVAKGAAVLGFGLILAERLGAAEVKQRVDGSQLAQPLVHFATRVLDTGRPLAAAVVAQVS